MVAAKPLRLLLVVVAAAAVGAGVYVAVKSDDDERQRRASSGLLWATDLDAVDDLAELTQAGWDAEQEPRAPDGGPVQTERIRVVEPGEVPGTGPHKPRGRAMRVELPPGEINPSGDTSRAEVYGRYPKDSATSTPPERWPDPLDSTRWYAFSVLVPEGFATDDDRWLLLTQWKGMYGGSPPIALELDADQFELGGTTGRRPLGPITPGRWTRFELGMHWSPDPEKGWVQVFRDGREVLPREPRATMDTYEDETKVDPVYLKQGIYRELSWPDTHVVHFGPTRVGTTREAVSER